MVPQGGSQWFPTFSAFDGLHKWFPGHFGNHLGNQSCNEVSPLESWPPTKVVPEPKMGTTAGTSRAPQMQKWFPFPVGETGPQHLHLHFQQTAHMKLPQAQFAFDARGRTPPPGCDGGIARGPRR